MSASSHIAEPIQVYNQLADYAKAIADGLTLFFPNPDDVFEVRILFRTGRRVAGFLQSSTVPTLANQLAYYATDPDVAGVYFTPQLIRRDLFSRAPNRFPDVQKVIVDNQQTTKPLLTHNEDVVGRRFLIIDCDPIRPKNVPATDQELAAARNSAEITKREMMKVGFNEPLMIDSGNGIHMYFLLNQTERITANRPPYVHETDLLVLLLSLQNVLHGQPLGVHIDTAVATPARIMRMPGTWNRKGTHSDERPHRMCSVISVPSDWTARLQSIADV